MAKKKPGSIKITGTSSSTGGGVPKPQPAPPGFGGPGTGSYGGQPVGTLKAPADTIGANLPAAVAAGKVPGWGEAGPSGVTPAAGAAPVDYGQIANTDPFGLIAAARNNPDWVNALGQQNQVEDTAAADYGFGLNRNVFGQVTGASILNNVGQIDPFSKAALLQQSFANQQNRTTNNYASMGQLYSGAIQNQRGQDQQGYDQGNDALFKSLWGILTGAEGTKTNAAAAHNQAIVDAGTQTLTQLTGMTPDQLKAIGLIKG